MKEINVEEIMEEIRREIRDKGYTSDMLSFTDVKNPIAEAEEMNFNINEFRNTVNTVLNTKYVPSRTDENIGSGIKGFIKRVVRKLVWFNIAPISDKQNIFNEQVSTAFLQLFSYIEEQDKLMKAYKDDIEYLKEELRAMEKK